MVKHDKLIGAIVIYRQEVRPFTDKQIELVANFAKQAIIAIENARLFNELRQSLEQQTATADVLKVISSSPGDLEPVFQSMLVKAVQICEAKFGVLFRCYHDSEFHAVAWVGVTPEYEKSLRKRQSFRPDADAPSVGCCSQKSSFTQPMNWPKKAAVLLLSMVAHVP
jgi:two-component system, NtrC family, sensor kinase